MTISGTRPLVDAKINGQEVRLLVDSGAFFSTISAATAKRLNLKRGPVPYGLSIRGVGGNAEITVGIADVMSIAGYDIPQVKFLVGGSEAGSGSSGILGQNFFADRNVEYNLAEGLIRVFKDTGCWEKFLAYWVVQGPPLPVTVMKLERITLQNPHAIGRAFVNGEKISVLFDSGAFQSVLSLKAAQRAGLKLDAPGVVDGGQAAGIGRGLVRSYIAPFASFKFAEGEEIKNARLRVADTDLELADMLIGADFFLSHRIFIASSQDKVYFTYNGGPVFDLRSTSAISSAESTAVPGAVAAQGAGAAQTSEPAHVGAAQSESNPAQASEEPSFLARRGLASAGRADYEHALADLTRAVDLAPSNPEYVYQRGEVYWSKNEREKAIADYDHALQLRPDFIPALMRRAALRIGAKNLPGARADLEAVGLVAAAQDDIRYDLGEAYVSVGLYDLAIAQFDLWIDSHPADFKIAFARNGRCRARGILGQDLPAALKDCDAAVNRSGKLGNAGVLANRALVRYRLADYDRAIADYDAALKMQPNSAWALYGRGLAKLKKNQRGEGDKDIADAVRIAPNVGDAYTRMGLSP